ncbi:MAG TPA: hypothetical protein ENJ09_12375 [Planctomycetes bacterium]|nr:hypothetical protein [Planctomycetota bacterium]
MTLPANKPAFRALFAPSERVVLLLMGCALTCVVLSVLVGALGALSYIPGISAHLVPLGLSLVQLRPLHTTFASAWIFLGVTAGVYRYLFDTFGEPSASDMRRFRAQMVLWGLAGLGILVTLPFGVTSGREYLGFHPAFSAMIAAGWILFAWTFFAKVARGFFARPVYVYMWTVGLLLFLWSFAEGHAYLLSSVRHQPVVDLQVQWKSCGTLVASFNQMVYGCLIYLGAKKSGDMSLGHSRSSFALFGIGVLNSFTNYAHHTYHLPQAHLIKWIAFSVSMLEIVLLLVVLREVASALQVRRRMYARGPGLCDGLVILSKRWNVFLLSLALIISVPPWNALVHGTHVVMAHAMGSELALDSYILIALFAYLLASIFPKREVQWGIIDADSARRTAALMNLALMGLVATLLASGFATGVQRYLGHARPEWMDAIPFAFVVFGCTFAYFLLRLLAHWLPLFLDPARHKALGWNSGIEHRAALLRARRLPDPLESK